MGWRPVLFSTISASALVENVTKESEPTCEGTPYTTKTSLKCEFHADLYEKECIQKGGEGYHLIHSELGSGHSNLPENFWSVIIRYRSKSD